MVFTNALSIIAIMFSHLFNTYEAVTPPPKAKKDISEEIQGDSGNEELDLLTPFGFSAKYQVPAAEKPSDQPTNQEPMADFATEDNNIPQEPVEYPMSNPLVTNIINTGRTYLGGKYTSGGTSPSTGFDCSGFLQYIFKQNGVDIPRDTYGIFKAGQEVSLSDVKPGDIICSRGSGKTRRHVQMVSKVDPETNQIYVIEAKGSKWGIVEGPLTKKASDIITIRRVLNISSTDPMLINQDIQSPVTKAKFSSRKDFAQTMIAGYRRALAKRNLDPQYAYILTAQSAIESGWGEHQSGKFNFGGIKAGKSTSGTYKKTKEWSPTKGYYHSVEKFRDFTSIDDYCDYRIGLLSNSRYNVFNQFQPNQAYAIVYHMLKKGYGSDRGGKASVKYANDASQIYNSLLKMSI